VHPTRAWNMFGREKPHWGEGRIVVIQPDVLGNWFNPETSIVVRSEDERKLAQAAFKDVWAEMITSGKPSWYEGEVDDGFIADAAVAELSDSDPENPDAPA
jgi:hypothetical protein